MNIHEVDLNNRNSMNAKWSFFVHLDLCVLCVFVCRNESLKLICWLQSAVAIAKQRQIISLPPTDFVMNFCSRFFFFFLRNHFPNTIASNDYYQFMSFFFLFVYVSRFTCLPLSSQFIQCIFHCKLNRVNLEPFFCHFFLAFSPCLCLFRLLGACSIY